MSEQFYNVKRVAQIITGSGDDKSVEQTMRKIRHWTNSDILSPIGDKHTGTGVSRLYDEDAVYIAALLLEITGYGVTVEKLESFEEWIHDLSEDFLEWYEAREDVGELVFQLAWDEDGSGFYRPVKEGGPLLWQIKFGKGKDETVKFTSSILINVTNVFQKMKW